MIGPSTLIRALHSGDKPSAERAARALKYISEADPNALYSWRRQLLQIAFGVQDVRVQWNLTIVIGRLPLRGADKALAIDLMFERLRGPGGLNHTFALQALFDLSANDPELRARVLPLVREALESGTPQPRAPAPDACSRYPEPVPDIEITLIVITLATAVLIRLRPLSARYQRVSLLCFSGVILLAQLASIGPHWQLLPEYAAVILLMWRIWRRRPSRLLPAVAALLCLVSLAVMWVLPVFSLPKPTGSYAVGTTGPMHWTDISRDIAGGPIATGRPRELVVQIWYPATAGLTGKLARYARFRELNLARSYESVIRTNSLLDAPVADSQDQFPVLIFGHRWGGSRTQDTFLVEELASHGYVVIAIDHPLNAARVELSDGTILKSDRSDALNHLESKTAAVVQAMWAKELAIWTADDEFALNQLAQLHPFSSRLNLANIGAFGHSFGGASSLALLGVDPRVKCAVNLDGWTFNALDRRTTQPILAVYEGSSEVRRPETGVTGELDRSDNAAVDASLARFGGLRAYVAGTQHLDFTDMTLVSPLQRLTYTGPIKGERIRTITRGLVVGFFDRNLKGTGGIPSYPEVKMNQTSPPS